MFDVLIREVAARFGLGDKALPLVQMLLAYMTAKETGGLAGFLEKFKGANLGPIIQSWLGGGPSAQPITNTQLETVLGASGGLLSQLSSRLGVGRDNITSSLGYLLPAIVGRLTPGGSIPSSLPPEVASLAAAGQGLLAAAPAGATAGAGAAGGGGAMKWLPWVVVALAAVFGLSYCGKNRTADVPASGASAPAAVEAPAPAASEAMPAPAASEPAAAPAAAPASAPDASASAAASDEPTGSAVVALMGENSLPALKVYFDSAKADVHGDFATKATEVIDFLKANPDAKAVISGYNDPTGNAAANAELSKNRAQAVQAALVAQGVTEDRTVLEKPAETTGTAVTNAASRRVEVVIRK